MDDRDRFQMVKCAYMSVASSGYMPKLSEVRHEIIHNIDAKAWDIVYSATPENITSDMVQRTLDGLKYVYSAEGGVYNNPQITIGEGVVVYE